MYTTLSKPLSVSSVNMTPEQARSLLTMRCTPTESAFPICSNPLWALYAMARSVNRLAKHWRMAFRIAVSPLTLSIVSCCPANDAPSRSSEVALDLMATLGFFMLSLRPSSQ